MRCFGGTTKCTVVPGLIVLSCLWSINSTIQLSQWPWGKIQRIIIKLRWSHYKHTESETFNDTVPRNWESGFNLVHSPRSPVAWGGEHISVFATTTLPLKRQMPCQRRALRIGATLIYSQLCWACRFSNSTEANVPWLYSSPVRSNCWPPPKTTAAADGRARASYWKIAKACLNIMKRISRLIQSAFARPHLAAGHNRLHDFRTSSLLNPPQIKISSDEVAITQNVLAVSISGSSETTPVSMLIEFTVANAEYLLPTWNSYGLGTTFSHPPRR